jgi:very-short-patch-repair endonuclease
MPAKSNTEEFIKRAKESRFDAYNYSKVNYINNYTKVIIICNRCNHEFLQTPANHLAGNECPNCNNRCLTTEFIKKAKQTHGNDFDYSKTKYINAHAKVTIICNKNKHEFEQTPNGHLRDRGCRKCGGTCPYTNEEFIEALKKVHGDKYDYSEVNYIDAKTKITIICKNGHGEFKQTAGKHIYGQQCPKCVKRYVYSKDEWLEKVNKTYDNFYDYSKVKYKNTETHAEIICPKHGSFFQTPKNHIKSGCPKCLYILTTKDFIEAAQKVHGNAYDYSKVNYKSRKDKIMIYCKIHKEYFNQNAGSHLLGCGCPLCVNKTETKLFNWLKTKFANIDKEAKFKWCKNLNTNKYLPLDFYIKEINCIIELDGFQHFRQVKNWNLCEDTQKRDTWKMQQANKQKISIIRLLQDDVYKNDDKWLDNNLLPLLIKHKTPTNHYLCYGKNKDIYNNHKDLYKQDVVLDDSIND